MPEDQPESVEGIKPNDDVAFFGEKLDDLHNDTLVAGHLPFMARLVAWLITGNKDLGMLAYQPGSVVCLKQQEEGGWTLEWMVRPELLGDKYFLAR
jgi:phosphohistidine phosphatase